MFLREKAPLISKSDNIENQDVAIDPEILQVLFEAITKNTVLPVICTPSTSTFHSSMFVIEAYPDDLAAADKLKLKYYQDIGMIDTANDYYDAMSMKIQNRMENIAKFLSSHFNLDKNNSPILLRHDTDPRFGNYFFYAPQYFRVAVNSNLISPIRELLSHCGMNVDVEEREPLAGLKVG